MESESQEIHRQENQEKSEFGLEVQAERLRPKESNREKGVVRDSDLIKVEYLFSRMGVFALPQREERSDECGGALLVCHMLNSRAFGSAVGVLAGAFWFFAMDISLLFHVGERTLTTLGSFHPYFTYSWTGMIVIVLEHLVGGYIIGWIFAKLYNAFSS